MFKTKSCTVLSCKHTLQTLPLSTIEFSNLRMMCEKGPAESDVNRDRFQKSSVEPQAERTQE